MNTIKNKHSMIMKLICLATWATAITATHLTAQTFTTLYSFTTDGNFGANSDGANPYFAGVILSGNTLYGTAFYGGRYGEGTVFAVNTDGSDFRPLLSFDGSDDNAYPYAGLLLSGNTLYGTAGGPGTTSGTVFAINTNGTGFTTLHIFTAANSPSYTNSDGAFPFDALILSSNTLYGTAEQGGSWGNGTVFAVNTDGTGFTNLHSFTAINDDGSNGDGAFPHDALILSGNTLYGTADNGGRYGYGTLFAINTDGTGFTNLYSFTAVSGANGDNRYGTNSDGAYPLGGVILSGNTLYGTTSAGGPYGQGTVFAVNTNGMGFSNLHSFTAASGSELLGTNSDGANPGPFGGLIISGNTLYGTAAVAGIYGNGTVFSITLPAPQLTIILSGTNVVLAWPTNVAGFSADGYTLQSTTNLVSPAVWSPVVPGPVIVSGQLTVTNPISGTQQFYRLSQ